MRKKFPVTTLSASRVPYVTCIRFIANAVMHFMHIMQETVPLFGEAPSRQPTRQSGFANICDFIGAAFDPCIAASRATTACYEIRHG